MKRALFIGGGTLAGVAAVLSYVPTNFSSSSTSALSVPTSGGVSTPSTATASTPAAPTPTTPTQAATPTQAPSQGPTSTQAPTTQAPTPTNPPAAAPVSKTATGATYSACGYGNVRVRITVSNGVVTKVDALSYPNGDPRSQFINQQAIPWLQQQTLAAKNSSQIAGVGGATCTTGAWTSSLQSALTAAGL
ncbi:FMN-binding domain protein [mine drainage metagenome]|uniref:FMN-binding domain protein n=1 Tax=mine drainage metagenome TaxID=410659 RepID=A0A1J5Q6C2_9ZZZZ